MISSPDITDINLHAMDCIVHYMEQSESEEDWIKRCLDVKAANCGNYPDEWYERIIVAGTLRNTRKNNNW